MNFVLIVLHESSYFFIFSADVTVIISHWMAISAEFVEVFTSAVFTCRFCCCRCTLLVLRCVDFTEQSTLAICILPGMNAEVVSVFPSLERLAFIF